MDSSCLRGSACRRAVVVIALLGIIVACRAPAVRAETPPKPEKTKAEVSAVREVRSRHFLVRSDLSRAETAEIVERLELMLGHISAYWGKPPRGMIECYVIRDLDGFPVAALAPDGARGVKTCGGITLMYLHREGNRQVVKSAVYASARTEIVQHETVHAYCYQTFGRIGPVWYSEGMAELAHYWKEGDSAVHADPREIEFLRNSRPTSLAATLSPTQVTGDCWQNYASRWSLCHFLTFNPNYSQQFRQLGRGLLTGKNVSFEQTYEPVTRELFFEYLFFLDHISQGYRVDLCAWNWRKKFTDLQPDRIQKVAIAAGRGWQPTGLRVRARKKYEYLASGAWQLAGESKDVDADGDDQHRGRLVGVLMKDRQLGAEFELGAKGSLQLETGGDLYLRCRNNWNELAADRGQVTVHLQLQGQDPPLRETDNKVHADPPAACGSATGGRQ